MSVVENGHDARQGNGQDLTKDDTLGSSSNPMSPGAESGSSDLQGEGEQEIDSKTLQIQSKRFYLDVKQNRRGRFIKIAEVGAGGRKSRLLLTMSLAAEFKDQLTDFGEFMSTLGEPNPDNLPENGKLKSSTLSGNTRRYYLDLKENQRGRFLRVSQTIQRGGPRSQIAIPAQGMLEFRDTLAELLETYGIDEPESQNELPDSKSLRSENKEFYFDLGQNNRGIYLRISEVRPNSYRSSITVPQRAWLKMRDLLNDIADECGTETVSAENTAKDDE